MNLHHIGIVVENIEEAEKKYQELFCVTSTLEFTDIKQKVKVKFLTIEGIKIELIEPLQEDSPISKFLKTSKSGIHHLAFYVGKELDEHIKKHRTITPKWIGFENRELVFLDHKILGNILVELVGDPK